ncbi:hypothetical protein [Candidatus Electronema sp. JM]|uniref:hypothetical protein n=1 Tax=Candidatus Electronema sp. JM TaxID=3401571 RepID=UPI003AA90B9F
MLDYGKRTAVVHLEPCPFCASPAVISGEFVGCPECEIGFSCKDNNFDDVGILAWNHRPCISGK